ncbi:uncharacterized protein [Gossypium hirsutum]|uniref:Uncharacterized protein n=1 Tax=Gossypium hirsutum TaxID=3635 RepID=A0A1U8KG34_GOSHI|nr:uncharacterized protein LOC107916628 [Gossypium hirsutum]
MFQVPMPAVQNDSNFLGDFISTLKASEGCILQLVFGNSYHPCSTAKKATLLTVTYGKNPGRCLNTWLLSSSPFRHRGHKLSEATFLSLKFFRVGIKFHKRRYIVMATFDRRCKFHNFL